MYAAVPGKTGALAIREGFSSTESAAKKPSKSIARLAALLEEKRKENAKFVQKFASEPASKPAPKLEIRGALQMSCTKGGPKFREFPRDDFTWKTHEEIGHQRRKCQHSSIISRRHHTI